MGFILATVAGLVVWIVLWCLDIKAIDAFMITIVIMVIGLTARMLAPYLPGNRPS